MTPNFTSPVEPLMDNAVTPNKFMSRLLHSILPLWSDCTSRAKPFAVPATDSIFDTEHISHGQSTSSPFCNTLLHGR